MNADLIIGLLQDQSFDSNRLSILTRLPDTPFNGTEIGRLVECFSFDDGRVNAVKHVAKGSTTYTLGEILPAVNGCSFDDGRGKVFTALWPNVEKKGLDEREVASLMEIFSFDDGREKAVRVISQSSVFFSLSCLVDVMKTCSFDSGKENVYNYLKGKVSSDTVTFSSILECLKCFSYDEGRFKVLDTFKADLGPLKNVDFLSQVVDIFSFNRDKVLMTLKSQIDIPEDPLAEYLSKSVAGVPEYTKTCEEFKISSSTIDKYKDKVKPIVEVGDVTFGSSGNVMVRGGGHCIINGVSISGGSGTIRINGRTITFS